MLTMRSSQCSWNFSYICDVCNNLKNVMKAMYCIMKIIDEVFNENSAIEAKIDENIENNRNSEKKGFQLKD